MSFLRGGGAPSEIWERFPADPDRFALWREGPWWVARTDAPAERTVALFHELTAELPGTVSVAILRARDGRAWHGDAVALADVREGVARLRPALARTGGLEVTLWGQNRQLSLTPQLSVWAWARGPQWGAVLAEAGLTETALESLADRRWVASREELRGSDELEEMVEAVVARLGLTPANGSAAQ